MAHHVTAADRGARHLPTTEPFVRGDSLVPTFLLYPRVRKTINRQLSVSARVPAVTTLLVLARERRTRASVSVLLLTSRKTVTEA
jgi:hypothetical protein